MHRFLLAAAMGLCWPSPAWTDARDTTSTNSSFEVMKTDTLRKTINGTTFIVPRRWSVRTEGPAVVLGSPEGDSQIAFVDVRGGDADAAVAAAWAAYRPGPLRPLQRAADAPPRNGWEQIRTYRYERLANEQRSVSVTTRRKGDLWTVAIYDMSNAVAEKRGSQIDLIFGNLFPSGHERETFAGKRAHRLDARRIAMLAEFIETAREKGDIPGVALGLVQDGEVVFAGGFGLRELGKTERVDADTLFNIASNGKALTTLLLAKLVDAGKFDWDTPVTALWPEFRLGDPDTTRQVLVRHLVCACTGLPRQDLQWLFESEDVTAATTMQMLASMQPTAEFGELYQYSNLLAAAGGFLGGHVLHPDRELGVAYDDALQSLVLDPLGMTATTHDFAHAKAGNYAAPHGFDVDGNLTVASMDLNAMALPTRPSGIAFSNVRDMLRYVQMELAQGVLPDGRRFISKDALLERSEPQVAAESDEYYGMGLKIETTWGVPLVHHGGTQWGYQSDMMWLPDHGVGAVILTNSDSGSLLRSPFRRRLLEILFDGEPQAVESMNSIAQLLQSRRVAQQKRLTVPVERNVSDGLAHRYRNAELGDLEIRREQGVTVFDFGGWDSEIATRKEQDGTLTFVTISPGADGFEFTLADVDAKRRLITREAQHEYVFTEVETSAGD